MLVVGGREMESGTVSIRDRIDGDVGSLPWPQAIEKLRAEVAGKVVRQVAGRSPVAALAEQGGSGRAGRRPCLLTGRSPPGTVSVGVPSWAGWAGCRPPGFCPVFVRQTRRFVRGLHGPRYARISMRPAASLTAAGRLSRINEQAGFLARSIA